MVSSTDTLIGRDDYLSVVDLSDQIQVKHDDGDAFKKKSHCPKKQRFLCLSTGFFMGILFLLVSVRGRHRYVHTEYRFLGVVTIPVFKIKKIILQKPYTVRLLRFFTKP